MVGEASGRMQKADCRDEIALPAAMLAWLKCGKQRTRNSRKRFLVFFCSLFVKARVVYRLRQSEAKRINSKRLITGWIEYSRAVTPQIRQAGNRLSGLAETAYASLLA